MANKRFIIGDIVRITSDKSLAMMNGFWHGKLVRIIDLPGTTFDYGIRTLDGEEWISVYDRELEPVYNGLEIMLQVSFGE